MPRATRARAVAAALVAVAATRAARAARGRAATCGSSTSVSAPSVNGGFTGLLFWVIAGLAALVSTLIGFVVHLHIKSDDENKRLAARELEIFKDYVEKEVIRLRDRVHDLEQEDRGRNR